LARHTGNAPAALLRQCVQTRGTGRVRAPLDAAHLHANATARAVEGNLGGFCVCCITWLRRHWLLCSRSICCTIQRLACTKRRPQVQGSSAYATARLRLCSGQQGARYARPAGLSRSPKHPAYRPLYRAIAGSFQGLLALGFRIASGHDHGRGMTQRRSIIPAVIVCMIAFVFLIGGHAPSNQVDFIIFLCVGIVVFLWWDEKRNKPKR
jgi:hypothetical protein